MTTSTTYLQLRRFISLFRSNYDDPSLPLWTFRMWFLGVPSCILLSFLNTFFGYRTQPLMITMISVQVVTLPLGKLMARILPETKYQIDYTGSWVWLGWYHEKASGGSCTNVVASECSSGLSVSRSSCEGQLENVECKVLCDCVCL